MSIDAKLSRLDLRVEQIMVLPDGQRCPECAAPGVPTQRGEWFIPFIDFYDSHLQTWVGHLGYLRFACGRRCHQHGGLRVARLGNAVLPVPFVDWPEAKAVGCRPDEINAGRVAYAVAYLQEHADPEAIAGEDVLAHILYAVAAGRLGPALARERIRQLMEVAPLQLSAALDQPSQRVILVRE